MIERCCFEMNKFKEKANVDIIPIGSYDIIWIKMDWLEPQFSILYYHGKTITCLDENMNSIQIKRIPRPMFVRQIFGMQMKKFIRKGC